MNNSINRLEQTFYVPRLIAATYALVTKVDWSDNNQIGLSCEYDDRDFGTQILAHGNVTRPSREGGRIVRKDEWYDTLIPEFETTYFAEIWNKIYEQTGQVWRMRLMRLQPKGCLSFHEDFYKRLHIPIITNTRCFFFINETNEIPWLVDDDLRVPSIQTYHLPADGGLYSVDTTKHHTVYNGGNTDRIHLVCSIK